MKTINPMHAKRVAEFERLTAAGMTHQEATKKMGVSINTIYASRSYLKEQTPKLKKVIVRRKRAGIVTAIEVPPMPHRLIAFVGTPSEVLDAVRGMQ